MSAPAPGPAGNRAEREEHALVIREEPCGCARLRCTLGCSPQEIVEALGLMLEDLLCDKHRDLRAAA